MSDPLRTRLKKHLRGLYDRHRVVVWHDESNTLLDVLKDERPDGVIYGRKDAFKDGYGEVWGQAYRGPGR